MKSVNKHNRLSQILVKSFTFLLVFSLSLSLQAQEGSIDKARQKEGKKLFKSLCASCHKLNKRLVGPKLGGVEERRENAWLKAWIKDNAALRATGDADAIAVFDEYKGSNMTAFPQLTDKNIDDILYYTTVGDIKKPTEVVVSGTEGGSEGGGPKWLINILAAAVVVGFLIIASLLKTISELKGAPKTPGITGNLGELWEGIKKNTFLHVLIVIFGALITAYFLFGTLFKVGVDQGYQPIQPIAFSHKIHAGDNKIDCQYCHSSAKHSKTSGIPSVNVCMNCHKNISEVAEDTKIEGMGKAQLDKEIQKIYAAVGWDTNTLEYTGKTKPVKWVRVHNLPDFAYFNHSQHVTVGGVKCQKCHGPVEEMDEVYQYSPLTMGWCIDCHKETKVDLKGNDYYKKIHEELSKKYGVDQVTVAQLGGKECGKCHY
ncbi:c-type cytochrome [Tenacibaculum maritimum]|uniref:Cytochrome c n=1 Tax=Tenacibaculum maritimum NCIMB 2154 TaxID=1349785 RepID=A0A2H1ED95_9FLAO|nr:c-type cytochrome [Tenacibaculum maritimum]MCD9585040.1 c-type cytochrome [Tenacibaculum maritimum]MCD9611072.1 c-type cytochrome [Tenacibaculum maritimum]MCD9620822.1 c-type cytochrome [Tenacibaculum maritimum]MCD9626893.1 c-type cytochrome [Tenacibaculum maritimum]MCD9629556.1 c-type cytochrome [Tenacibaculum maritimum]